MKDKKVGAVMVVGGGVAGIQASLDLADSGFKVYLVEKGPSIGGVMAQLDKTFPTNDCSMCILSPKLVATGRHPNITILTNADIMGLSGEAGNFEVKIRKNSRYIIEDKCNGCGICAQKCPIEAVDTFNEGLANRGAVYVEYPQAVPLKYKIDREKCIGCGTCYEICKARAIAYDQKESEATINVGSIILAPGFEPFDAKLKSEYGYGRFQNVVTSIEFERILSASGPYGGLVLRPSDGEIPKRIAFIQCVGSRDYQLGNTYCSAACCMYGMKEAVIAKEHAPINMDASIFYMDMRSYGKEFDAYRNRAEEEYGIRFTRSRVAGVTEDPATGNPFRSLCAKRNSQDGRVRHGRAVNRNDSRLKTLKNWPKTWESSSTNTISVKPKLSPLWTHQNREFSCAVPFQLRRISLKVWHKRAEQLRKR